jgi:DeoR/GlpR family transcriptional regulator of sugar metabolism
LYHKTIKRKEYAELCKCSIATAQRDLDEFVSKEELTTHLTTHSIHNLLERTQKHEP